mmetsp:Transcript_662/g.796  ORF Transcript_662/g.796 Transcript_662/m.796 type:complete len:206 (+) Transcript_662:412-1029(+)
MSMSPMASLVSSRSAGIAAAGPIPISSGRTPTTLNPRNTPMIGAPSSSALLLRINNTAAAPSLTCDEFPAVVLPPFLNAGLSFANPSTVVPARGPSSFETTTSFSLPSLSSMVTFTGTISLSNLPSFWACSARLCDSAAMASCSSRVIPYRSATVSLVIPIGVRDAEANVFEKISFKFIGGREFGSPGLPPLVMLSTPAPMPASM